MAAKIKLSKSLIRIMQDESVILTKLQIIHAVYDLFGDISCRMRENIDIYKNVIPETAFYSVPKISRGENYKNLPWVMLDYPAYFSKSAIFAVRTFFWWGHFVSITLHLSGLYKEQYFETLFQNLKKLDKGFYVSVAENEWEHHFGKENYKKYSAKRHEQLYESCRQKQFVKIALKFKLKEWDNMQQLLHKGYVQLGSLILKEEGQ